MDPTAIVAPSPDSRAHKLLLPVWILCGRPAASSLFRPRRRRPMCVGATERPPFFAPAGSGLWTSTSRSRAVPKASGPAPRPPLTPCAFSPPTRPKMDWPACLKGAAFGPSRAIALGVFHFRCFETPKASSRAPQPSGGAWQRKPWPLAAWRPMPACRRQMACSRRGNASTSGLTREPLSRLPSSQASSAQPWLSRAQTKLADGSCQACF